MFFERPLVRAYVDETGDRGKPLHWAEHVKRFPRRQFVASQLAAVPGVVVNYVVFEKAAIPLQAVMRSDQVLFYNYVAGLRRRPRSSGRSGRTRRAGCRGT